MFHVQEMNNHPSFMKADLLLPSFKSKQSLFIQTFLLYCLHVTLRREAIQNWAHCLHVLYEYRSSLTPGAVSIGHSLGFHLIQILAVNAAQGNASGISLVFCSLYHTLLIVCNFNYNQHLLNWSYNIARRKHRASVK